MKRWMMACLGVVAVSAMALGEEAEEHRRDAHGTTKLPFTVSKETTGIVSPLHADGTVDYVTALNEKYGKGVKAEENAFVGWLKVVGTNVLPAEVREKVLGLCGVKKEELGAAGMLHTPFPWELVEDEKWLGRHLWAAEDYPKEAAFLKEEEKSLDAAKEAFGRPRFWVPYVFTDGPVLGQAAFSSSKYQESTNHLLARAMLRAKGGDFEGFLTDVMAVKRMGLHVASSTSLFEGQTGYSMSRSADGAIGATAGEGIFDAEQCQALGRALDGVGEIPTLAEAIEGQRWMILDATAYLAAGKGFDFGEWSTVERESVDWDGVLKEINKTHDEVMKAMEKNKLEAMEESLTVVRNGCEPNDGKYGRRMDETKEVYSARLGRMLVSPFWGGVGGSEEVRREAVMQHGLARVVVAAAQYRAEKKSWPEKLEELAPGYLKAIPKDLFSEGGEEPIAYARTTSVVVVKSVGIKIGGTKGKWVRKEIEVGAQ